VAHTTAEYDLFLDESGDFRETSTDLAELKASNSQPRAFPSQLAGVLALRGTLTKGEARKLLHQALAAAGLPPGPVHANQLPKYARDKVFRAVAEGLGERRWQPVRVVNRERVRYGDRVATYTSLVAELVLRVCERRAPTGASAINLRLICARVKTGEDDEGRDRYIESADYLRRVQEYLGFAAVRHGRPRESAAWRLESLRLSSGKDDPELQLCDVVSYASHDDFSPCDTESAQALRAAFGTFDFALSGWELTGRVDRLCDDGLLGAALQALAEGLVCEGLGADLRAAAKERLRAVLAHLVRSSAPARDPHLAGLVNWLEQTIDLQRALDVGYRLAIWLREQVLVPLRAALAGGPEAGSLDWFAFALHTWALAACNHRGALADARREVDGLNQLLPALAGRWEHATLLMRGFVVEAVHRTDCFEFAEAADKMELVAGYYGTLGTMFGKALPAVFHGRVRSDLCGQALGTGMQSELYAGLQADDPERFARARALSDRSIDEFPGVADQERQYQYRSQLETAAGNWADARRWLARSFRLEGDAHTALAAHIQKLADVSPVAQGFGLLHWLRLGASALGAGARDEGDAFLAAIREADVLAWPWCRGEQGSYYPVHGILRRVAVIAAHRTDPDRAAEALTRLAAVLPDGTEERAILSAIRLAAHAEAAAVLWPARPRVARTFLDHGAPGYPGLLQQLDHLREVSEKTIPRLWAVVEPWGAVVRRLLGGDPTAGAELLRLARRIGY
jgi:hypothetical protein